METKRNDVGDALDVEAMRRRAEIDLSGRYAAHCAADMLALCAEVERLRAEVELMRLNIALVATGRDTWSETAQKLAAERDALKAEIERLRGVISTIRDVAIDDRGDARSDRIIAIADAL